MKSGSFRKDPWRIGTTLMVVSLLLTAVQVKGQDASAPNVTVYAAASLQNALTQIGRKYEEANPKTKVLFSFDSSGALARKIEAGAPADVYISASEKWMQCLVKQQKVPSDQTKVLLRNRLICVVPFDSELKLKGPEDLANVSRIAIGDPVQAPAGEYAMEALKKLGLWEKLDREKRMVFGSNVRIALSWVESKEVPAGIVYQSDAKASTKVKQAFVFPSVSHSPITYLMGPVSGSPAARGFMHFLESDLASDIFSQQGFIPAAKTRAE
jgi:molybdate transport system substrate-binding protein